jgi:nucleoside-diphosphate-sugar epimerase
MTTKHKHDNPVLVTRAAGAVGGIGRNLTEFLLARGHKVRALVRREDERAEALQRLGAEVVEGDLTDLASMHTRCGHHQTLKVRTLESVSAL